MQAALLQRERLGLGPEGVAPHIVQQLLVLGTAQRAVDSPEEVEQAHLQEAGVQDVKALAHTGR